jgi:RimJ/RimL family protein N-acetyltransferase
MSLNDGQPVTANLKNGLVVTIRPLAASDRDKVATAVRGLEAETIYTRLFSHRKELSEAGLDRIMQTRETDVALVATVGTGPDERIVGGARYVVTRTSPAPTAEVAFTVEEDFQGRGIAGRLLESLADVARARGIRVFEADVLADNASMLHVFDRFGAALRKRSEGGVLHIEFDLAQR